MSLSSPITNQTKNPLIIHLITHNHWDREWIFTAKYANRWLIPFFDNLFKMLERQPDYRFVLDGQMLIIDDYLNQLAPDVAAAKRRDIRNYVHKGQLLIGPAYLQPDWSLVSGESLVRNLLIGHKMAQNYGVVMKAGWLLDNFGQIAQAPQIFRGFDIPGAFVWRGVEMPPEALKTEFWWEAPDGSRILGVYLLDSYRNAMVLAMARSIAQERILSHARVLERFATTPNVLLMNGYEQVPEPDDVLPIIAEVNQTMNGNAHCIQSTPPDYLDAILNHKPELPVLNGYFYSGRYAPILKGVYSSRSYLNQQNNFCQRELERWAEPFTTMAWAYGFDYPEDRFESTWKTLLVNHTHDDVCGCCIDPIARDMQQRFDEVYREACTLASESLRAIAQTINTTRVPSATAVVVFNPSFRSHGEVVGFSLELDDALETFHLQDGHGRIVPYQLTKRIGQKADVYLYAEDIPSLGYRTYYLLPGSASPPEHPRVTASATEYTAENDFLKLTINPDGTLTLWDKVQKQSYENLGYFESGGDSGDTYDYSYPQNDQIISSRGKEAKISLELDGPLIARFRIELTLDVPVSLTEDRQSRTTETRPLPIVSIVELTANARHVEIQTTLNNVVKDHRLRIHFPSRIAAATTFAGEPFDIASFPISSDPIGKEIPEALDGLMLAGRYTAPVNTYPFQHLVGLMDEKCGLTIFSHGLMEFETSPEDGTLMLTLLRGVGWLTRNDLLTRVGDVGPHIFTPEAQCLGTHTYDYAIYPHGPDLPAATPHYASDRHTIKFRAVQTNAHDGHMQDELSFLGWESEEPKGSLKLTALKLAEAGNGLIIRFYNTQETDVEARLKIGGRAETAWLANLNERPLRELRMTNGVIEVRARGKEIVTIKVGFTPWSLIDDYRQHSTRVLLPLAPDTTLPQVNETPLLTEAEVEAEQARAAALETTLQEVRSTAFVLNAELERTATPDIAKQAELQRLKSQEATLTRQHYEAYISALLNQQLYVTHEMEAKLDEIGQAVSWARVRKRVGEFLSHYYEGALNKANGK